MSGVIKDDPTAPDGEGPVEAAPAATAAETGSSSADEKTHGRKAPFLRVVTDAAEFTPASTIDSPHQRIGAVIRAARENQGLTFEQVSKDTKVTVSHLRAIEDMTPNIIGEAVYVKGHIRTYARHLGLNPDEILKRYMAECAILKDPEKQDIAPPQTSRKLPVAVPVLGVLLVGLVGAAALFLMSGQNPAAQSEAAAGAEADAPRTTNAATPAAVPATTGPALRIVAVKRATLEVRSSDGTKYVSRVFEPGQSYNPRVGYGHTITTNDGSAFEWKLGEQSLGLVSDEARPAYGQSVDLAATRTPIVVEAPPAEIVPTDPLAPGAVPPPLATGAIQPPAATGAARPPAAAQPTPPRPRPPQPAPTPPPVSAETVTPPQPAPTPAIAPPTPANDASLQAYPPS